MLSLAKEDFLMKKILEKQVLEYVEIESLPFEQVSSQFHSDFQQIKSPHPIGAQWLMQDLRDRHYHQLRIELSSRTLIYNSQH